MVTLRSVNTRKEGENPKTAILGGGLSGLTIGYLLNKRGLDFEVLEQDAKCGGLMRSKCENGFTFDRSGSHILFSKNKEALGFILQLLAGNIVEKKRNSKILYNNRFVKYPFENGLSDLPLDENFECLNAFVQNLIIKAKEAQLKIPSNLKMWFYHTFGAGIAEKYLIPYNEKIWKFPIEKLSLDWVQRIPDPPIEDIIKSSLGITTEGYQHQLFFNYPKVGGIEAVIDSLTKPIAEKITTKFKVQKITQQGDKWVVSDGCIEKCFDRIVSTIPVQHLVSAFEVPKPVRLAANELKYNSIVTIMIGLNKRGGDLSWLYIPDHNILTHRISFPSNYSPCVAPPANSSILAEVTCMHEDKTWRRNDDDLIKQVIADLCQLKIMDKSDVIYVAVDRSRYAYVLNEIGWQSNLRIIREYFDTLGINLVGRFSEYRYMNMDDCVASAMNYVNNLGSSRKSSATDA